MKTLVFSILAVAVAAVAVRAEPSGAPRIFMPELRYDFGTKFEQPTYTHDFVVENKGDANLVIDDVVPGCGCTVAKFDSVITPGGRGTITLVLDGRKVWDEWEKTADVHSNDPDHQNLTITIAGKQVPYVGVSPKNEVYLLGRYGDHVERSLTLKSNQPGFDLKIKGIESNIDPLITYKAVQGDKPGEWVLKVWKNPKLPTMTAYGVITVHTNHPVVPDKSIQVQVVTRGWITVQPSFLNYGLVRFANNGGQADPVTKDVTLLRTSGEFRIRKVNFDSDRYKAKIDEEVPGKKYKITVTFRPPVKEEPNQVANGEMIVHTDDPSEPFVRVKLVARAR